MFHNQCRFNPLGMKVYLESTHLTGKRPHKPPGHTPTLVTKLEYENFLRVIEYKCCN